MKKIIVLSMIICQLVLSCSSDDSSNNLDGLSSDIDALLALPYSKLSPSEQKVKLEAEANDMLVQMDKSKTSGAIEAIQNLENLLSIGSIDIFNGKNDNQIEDILNVSGVYAIYTWNKERQDWIKTSSTSELKFVFPANKYTTTNNASFSSKSTSSNIKVEIEDSYNYNWQTDVSITINDYFYLPTSVDATLTINNVQAATFVANAKYTGTIEAPDEASFKMVLSDGYTFEISGGKKATANFAKSSFSYNGKNLISFNAGSTADIDALIEYDALIQYQGKANGLVQIMDNFIIVADMDIAGLASDEAALEKTLIYPDYNSKTYFTDINNYNSKESAGYVVAYNKNVKLMLVSKKDGTKIADIIQHSEKGYFYYDTYNKWVPYNNSYGGYWDWNNNQNTGTLVQDYDTVLYLKFNDNTEAEMSAYFSSGFETLETKFEDFFKSFER
jgi:hypothetical protein